VFEVGLNRAVALLAEKRAGGGRRQGASTALKELGEHPTTGKPVRILAGRYGAYVKHEDVNATIPKSADPAMVTMEEALALLAARPPGKAAARTARGGKTPAKSTAKAARPAAKAKAPRAKAATVKTVAAKPRKAAPKKTGS